MRKQAQYSKVHMYMAQMRTRGNSLSGPAVHIQQQGRSALWQENVCRVVLAVKQRGVEASWLALGYRAVQPQARLQTMISPRLDGPEEKQLQA